MHTYTHTNTHFVLSDKVMKCEEALGFLLVLENQTHRHIHAHTRNRCNDVHIQTNILTHTGIRINH